MKYIFGAGITAAAAMLLYMGYKANDIKEKRHVIQLKTVKGFRPFKLVFLADIHRKKLPENFLASPVDAIVIGGDLTERGVPMQRTAENLRILTAAAPVYFVWGNHDYYSGERNLRKLLNHYGVKILENESVELFGDTHLKLVGVDFYTEAQEKMGSAFSEVYENDTVLFAAHSPANFKWVEDHGTPHLMMAGHLHGGQIRLGKLGLFQIGSLSNEGSGWELVTNGYGTRMLPLRLGAEAQYHVLDIYPDLVGHPGG